MKAVIIYDTVSAAKVTAKVAEEIAGEMRENGATVDLVFVESAGKVKIEEYDLLVLGAPTMAWRPSDRMKKFMASLDGKDFSGMSAATFDTQLKSFISGNATQHMDKTLKALGFKIIAKDLLAYVKNDKKSYLLRDGEIEKIRKWARDLIYIS